MTYREKVIEIIKKSKKYSKLNLIYDQYEDGIEYVTNDNSFKVEIDDLNYCFIYSNYHNILYFKVKNQKMLWGGNLDSKKVISKFGLIIKYLNKLDYVLIKLNEKKPKIISTISNIIKNEYGFINENPFFKNFCIFRFPMDRIRVRNRMKNVYFDILKNDLENIAYEIIVNFKKDDLDCNLKFNYLSSDNKITMIQNNFNYRNKSKNITNIIRCERLKQLAFLND